MEERGWERQTAALTLGAFTFPAVVHLPGAGWPWALGACILSGTLLWGTLRLTSDSAGAMARAKNCRVGKLMLLLVLGWNFAAMGGVATQVCLAYPTGRAYPLAGLLLLLLATEAARRGLKIVLRVGTVVLFLLAGFYAPVVLFALPEVKLQWLRPVACADWTALAAALTPMSLLYIKKGEGHGAERWILAGGVFAALTSIVCAGLLSPTVVTEEAFPFYTAAGVVRLFGVAERTEALVSAAASGGGFCLLGLLAVVNGELAGWIWPGRKQVFFVAQTLLAAAAIGLTGCLSSVVYAIGTTICWGLLPLLTLYIGNSKKLKKNEKRA